MDAFDKAFTALNRAIVGFLLAATFAIVLINVVLRYGFGTSLSWSEEAARFLMVAGAFFGAGLALREGRLVAIELLQDLMPERLRIVLRMAVALLMLVFMAGIVWFGIAFAEFGWNKETMSMQISRGIPYMAIPLGAAFFIAHLLLFFRQFIAGDFIDTAEPGHVPHSPDGA